MGKVITLLILFTNCISVFCQSEFKPSVGIGVHGGVNLSKVLFEPSIRQTSNTSYTGGIIVNYLAEEYAGIQVEFNYSQRGWQDFSQTYGTYKRTMSFYEFPLLAHIYIVKKPLRKLKDTPKILFNIDIGPYIATQTSYMEDYDKSLIPAGASTPDSIVLGQRTYYGKSIDNTFDYGFMAGGCLGVSTKQGEFLVRFRYVQGLANVFSQYPEGNFRFSQTQTLNIGFAWIYPFYFGVRD